jgi:hypothetical protein
MLQLLEQQTKLTKNQWLIAGAATLGDMLDFFDFLLIGFVLAFIVNDWQLTYGQSGAILLASGVSAPFGLPVLWLARRQGRPPHRADRQRAERLGRHWRDGADPARRLDLPVGLPLCRRFRRDRPLFGRHHPDAGIHRLPETRLDHRPHHHDAAGGLSFGGVAGGLCDALYRVARPLRRRVAAGPADPLHPRLCSRIAALAVAPRPA